jgi:hypothetical protein
MRVQGFVLVLLFGGMIGVAFGRCATVQPATSVEYTASPTPQDAVIHVPFDAVRCKKFKIDDMDCVYCASSTGDHSHGGPSCDWSKGSP